MIIIFWEMTPCGSYKNRRFGGSSRLHLQGARVRAGVISQKMIIIIVTAVETSNLTIASAFAFFRVMTQRWRWIFQSHRTSNRWWNLETWVSFLNVETREQSKQWMHTHLPKKLKKFKRTLSACQKADGSCFLGEERSSDGGSYAKRTTTTCIA
jgi:hypothetical protein